MHKVVWDKEINGILLMAEEKNLKVVNPPRPVFWEELNLLNFDKFWKYPKSDNPLLWAVGRKYYYKGEFVAEAKGGNIFEPPKVVISEKAKNLTLEPIDIEKVVMKNREALFILENEAMDFIEHTFKVYKKKGYIFSVGYSGGKDSQVVLDLVTRVIPPNDLIVLFSDTTMEIPYTYENFEETKKKYLEKYPKLRFHIVKPPMDALELWKKFGPPSRLHRWCCTVTKSVPFVNFIKTISQENEKVKIVVFDGVRSEESVQRSNYQRLGIGEKHFFQVNAEVIRDWNVSEVFLYHYFRNLRINKGYRYGLNRIGCAVCPFSSNWSEFILSKLEKDLIEKYLDILKLYTLELGIKNKQKIKEYIIQGQWKKRAGGEGITNNDKHLELISRHGILSAIIKEPNENFLEWIKVIGDSSFHKYEEGKKKILGEIKINRNTYSFEIDETLKKQIIKIQTNEDKSFKRKITKILYKTTYCVHCGACEAECPTNALKVSPVVEININLCAHCGNCLNFVEKGCLVAKSLQMSGRGRNMSNFDEKMKLKGFGRYLTFGLRDEWLNAYLKNMNNWFIQNNLGNKQVESMKVWLYDSEIIDKNKLPTLFAKNLQKIYNQSKSIAWALIWTNLYYNSTVCRFYVDNLNWNEFKSSKDLVEIVKEIDYTMPERTIKSGITSLFNMFENSPLGNELKLGVIEKIKRERFVNKIGTDDIHPYAVAYSLYKVAEKVGRKDFTLSELYADKFEGGPYKLFGISKDKLERILRGLQEDREQILRIDLTADLDNIYLRDDLSSNEILEIIGGRIK